MQPGETRRCLKEILKYLGPIDVACNCTGVSHFWRKVSEEDEVWWTFLPPNPRVASGVLEQTAKDIYRALPHFIPIIHQSQLKKFSLLTNQSQIHTLKVITELDDYSTCCFLDESTLIACGGIRNRNCYRINHKRLMVIDLPSLSAIKRRPGIIIWESMVLLFGGYGNREMLRECERMEVSGDLPWEVFGEMEKARIAFTPVAVGDQIYLIGVIGSGHIEVYSPSSNTFRQLQISGLRPNFTSSFLWNNQVYILNGDRLLEWLPESTSADFKLDLSVEDVGRYWSSIAPVAASSNSAMVLLTNGEGGSRLLQLDMGKFSWKMLRNV